ncbi:MAG: hypothetical protein AWU57_622 [Marinobacter sp. T13-3]|nr:MAG: hypothetical protein AWU57_622 [Marinobacter sp. T13-3]
MSKHEKTASSFQGAEPMANWWKPEQCPITNLPFFMWIEHPKKGWTPTYGGPLDSYTIPEFDGDSYTRERFDHDEGAWILDEVEDVGVQIVDDQLFVTEKDPDTKMEQTRLASLVEAIVNTIIGFMVSLALWPLATVLFDIPYRADSHIGVVTLFTVASIGRTYVVRRFFNRRIKVMSAWVAERWKARGLNSNQ